MRSSTMMPVAFVVAFMVAVAVVIEVSLANVNRYYINYRSYDFGSNQQLVIYPLHLESKFRHMQGRTLRSYRFGDCFSVSFY